MTVTVVKEVVEDEAPEQQPKSLLRMRTSCSPGSLESKRSGKTFRIALSRGRQIALNTDQMIDESDFEWKLIDSWRVENNIKVYSSFILVGNTFYVAHGSILS